MGLEIERKFLVNKDKWNNIEKPDKSYIRQGYLLTDPDKTIRIRLTDHSGFLTIKGRSVGATRLEYEYEIPKEDALQLFDNFSINSLSKMRYKILFQNKVWEVDEFLGDNAGLMVAEIELTEETEQFEIPDWIGLEVTGIEKYYNSNLSINPFKNW